MQKTLRVAIVCDWLTNLWGAEQVILQMTQAYPQADIFTSVYNEEGTHHWFSGKKVVTSWLQNVPWAQKRHQLFAPLRPMAFESLDLSGYDIVLMSSSAEAKGVITKPQTLSVCYCHTPTRYYWSDYHEYKDRMQFGLLNPLVRLLMPYLVHKLRLWDRLAADRPDVMIANSEYVSRRITKYYRRSSSVLYPPVDVNRFVPIQSPTQDYYLCTGRLIPYKRIDLAVEAARLAWVKLKVVGTGPMLEELRQIAGETVEFLWFQPLDNLITLMQNAKAFIFPSEEDFGIVPVEAMAAGVPVIAYGVGGATESVVDGQTGIFFSEQTPQSLADAIRRFEMLRFYPSVIRARAETFSEERFRSELTRFVQEAYQSHIQKFEQKSSSEV